MTHRVVRTSFCSTLAIATAMLAAPETANAQFVGTADSAIGANVHTLGNGQLQINVNNPQAVINWTATGASTNGVITFLPAGNVVNYQGNNTFAVLNRVAPGVAGSAIKLDGTISTSVNGQSGGGTVFFQSPNGIIVGANAVIDIGALGLTTLPISNDSNGNWFTGTSSAMTVNFGQATNAAGFVRVDQGAQLSVGGNGAYMAIVAPRVEIYEKLRSDGSIGLVAAEAATLTMRDSGLWDIIVTTGTSDANGVVISGNGGVARRNPAIGTYDHAAYIAAVSKNDALTMLFGQGTQLGFDVAGSAAVEDNVVVLSAGANVENGEIVLPQNAGVGHQDMTLDGVTLSSTLHAGAHGAVSLSSESAASSYARDVSLSATRTVYVNSGAHNTSIAGNLTIDTRQQGTAGNVDIYAGSGSTLSVAGTTTIRAAGTGALASDDGSTAQTGTGGDVWIASDQGGHINLGTVTVNADGIGGLHEGFGGSGGAGQGGHIYIETRSSGSTVQMASLNASAQGYGGTYVECSECSTKGGSGSGGTVAVWAKGGTMQIGGNVTADVRGYGGYGDAGGGAGKGGSASVNIAGGGSLSSGAAQFKLIADGAGGGSQGSGNAGNGEGGVATVGNYGGGNGGFVLTNAATQLSLSANGHGGDSSGSGSGGSGVGGGASVDAPNVALNASGGFLINATGTGGNSVGGTGGLGHGGSAGFVSYGLNNGGSISQTMSAAGTGGNGASGGGGEGGSVYLASRAGAVNVNGGSLNAAGTGGSASGAGGTGGSAKGGTASINSETGGDLTIASAMTLNATATGGAATGANGTGGTATGGSAYLIGSPDGTINLAAFNMNSFATGGAGSLDGGAAIGGNSGIEVGGGAVTVNGALVLASHGVGGDGASGSGGNGTGGQSYAHLTTAGSILTANATTRLMAGGFGGNGAVNGGDATGGWSRIYGTSGTAHLVGAVDIWADAKGGNGGSGSGGDARGGRARLNASGSTFQLDGALSLSTYTIGGDGHDGGNAFTPYPDENNTAVFGLAGGHITVAGSTRLDSSAIGGTGANGGVGGNATGGTAYVQANGGSVGLQSLSMTATANAGSGGDGVAGGAGGAGGAAEGGSVLVVARNSATAQDSVVTTGGVNLSSRAYGGYGGAGGAAIGTGVAGAGGRGGNASGGFIQIGANSANGHLTTAGTVYEHASAYAGNGGAGGAGGSGTGGAGGDGGDARGGSSIFGTTNGDLSIAGNGGSVNIAALDGYNDSDGGDGGNGGTGALGDGNGGNGGDGLTSHQSVIANGGSVTIGDVHLWVDSWGGDAGTGAVAGTAGDAYTSNVFLDFRNRGSDATQRATVNLGPVHGYTAATSDSDEIALGGLMLNAENANVHLASYDMVVEASGSLDPTSIPDPISLRNSTVTVDGAFNFNTRNRASLWIDNGSMTAASVDLSARDWVHSANGTPGNMGTLTAGTIGIASQNNIVADANLVSLGDLSLVASGAIDLGNLMAGGFMTIGAGTSVKVGKLDADEDIDVVAGTTILAGDVAAGGDASLSGGGAVTLGKVTAGGAVDLSSSGSTVTTGALSANGGNLKVASMGAFTTAGGALAATGDIDIDSGSANLGAVTADGGLDIDVAGALTAAPILAGGAIDIVAGSATLDTVQGASIRLLSSGAATTKSLKATAGNVAVDALAGLGTTTINATGNIELDGGTSVTTGALTAGGSIEARALGALAVGGAITATSGHVALGAGTNVTTGTINAGDYLLVLAGNNISLGAINVGGAAYLGNSSVIPDSDVDPASLMVADPTPTGGNISIAGGISAASLRAAAGGAFSVGDINVPGLLSVSAVGDISTGAVSAGETVDLAAGDYDASSTGSILIGNVSAAGSISLTAAGSIGGNPNLTAGDSVTVRANGNVNVGNVSAGIVNPVNPEGADYRIALLSRGGNVTAGNLQAIGEVQAGAGGALRVGQVTGYNFFGLAGTTIDAGTIDVGDTALLANYSMMAAGGEFGSGFDADAIQWGELARTGGMINVTGNIDASRIRIGGGGNVSTGALTATWGDIDVGSNANISTGGWSADGSAYGDAAGGITVTGDIDSGYGTYLQAGGAITTQHITAGFGGVTIGAAAKVKTGNITVDPQFNETFGIGVASAGLLDITVMTQGDIDTGALTTLGGSVNLVTGGSLTAGTTVAGGHVIGLAQNNIGMQSITAGDTVMLGGTATYDDQFDVSHVLVNDLPEAAGGTISTGAIDAGGDIAMAAIGNVSLGAVRADWDVDVETMGSIGGSTVSAGDSISMLADKGITLTDLDAGIQYPAEGGDFDIGLATNGALQIGKAIAAGDIGLAGKTGVTGGNLTAGGDLLVLSGGSTTLGALGAGGRIGIGGFAILAAAGGTDDFDKEVAFDALDLFEGPTTGGAVTIGGAVNAASLRVLAGGDLTTAAVTAEEIEARSTGTAHVGGAWQAYRSVLASNDVDIGANGSISAFDNQLVSTNAGGAFVGGGLSPTTGRYVLDANEFARLSGNGMISVDSYTSAPTTMTLGNLGLQGGGERYYSFGAYTPAQRDGAGTMRVLGDIVGTGFNSANSLTLAAGRIEMDAVNARIALTGQGSAPAGRLYLTGSQIWVASPDVLAKLAADPNYAFRDYDLQTPAANRPDGYMTAGRISFRLISPDVAPAPGVTSAAVTNSASLLLQNSGTSSASNNRAGFFANSIDVVVDERLAAAGTTMIINGQLTGEGGNLTGKAVRDAFVGESTSFPAYDAKSTINGCLLVGGACPLVTAPPPPPPPYNPDPPLQSQIVLYADAPRGGPAFGNEETIEDNQEGGGADSASAAITPPIPLFDSTALDLAEDSEDPVGGGGNAALMKQCGDPDGECEGDK